MKKRKRKRERANYYLQVFCPGRGEWHWPGVFLIDSWPLTHSLTHSLTQLTPKTRHNPDSPVIIINLQAFIDITGQKVDEEAQSEHALIYLLLLVFGSSGCNSKWNIGLSDSPLNEAPKTWERSFRLDISIQKKRDPL
ncbi:hypothetical protein OAQ84_01950 [Bdellovibrionales bacterium]|nr:hypothetical protein [Bdellovibrionales bacterium]